MTTSSETQTLRKRLPFHLSPLGFDISNLELLSSEQLALVQYHAQCDETMRIKAEIIFWRRRERDLALLDDGRDGFIHEETMLDSPPCPTIQEINGVKKAVEAEPVFRLDFSKLKPLPPLHGAAEETDDSPLQREHDKTDTGTLAVAEPVDHIPAIEATEKQSTPAETWRDSNTFINVEPEVSEQTEAGGSVQAAQTGGSPIQVKPEPVEDELPPVQYATAPPVEEPEEGEIRSEDGRAEPIPVAIPGKAEASSLKNLSMSFKKNLPMPFKKKQQQPVAAPSESAEKQASSSSSSRSIEPSAAKAETRNTSVRPQIVRSEPIGRQNRSRDPSEQMSEKSRGKQREMESPDRGAREGEETRKRQRRRRERSSSSSSSGSSRSRSRTRQRSSRRKSRREHRERDRKDRSSRRPSSRSRKRRRRSYSSSSSGSSSSRSTSSSRSGSSSGSYSSSSRSRSRSSSRSRSRRRTRAHPAPMYMPPPGYQGYPQAPFTPMYVPPPMATYTVPPATVHQQQAAPTAEEEMSRTQMAHLYRGAPSNPEEKAYTSDVRRAQASPPRPVRNSTSFPGEQQPARMHPDRQSRPPVINHNTWKGDSWSARDSPPPRGPRTPSYLPSRPQNSLPNRPQDTGWGQRTDNRGGNRRRSPEVAWGSGRSPAARNRGDPEPAWGSGKYTAGSPGMQSGWGSPPPSARRGQQHPRPSKPAVAASGWDTQDQPKKRKVVDPWADDVPKPKPGTSVWGDSPEPPAQAAQSAQGSSVWD